MTRRIDATSSGFRRPNLAGKSVLRRTRFAGNTEVRRSRLREPRPNGCAGAPRAREPIGRFADVPGPMPDLSNRLPVTGRLAALPLVLTLVAACSGASATPTPSSPGATPGASPTPAVTAGPTVGAIDHKTGATDVILRLEEGGGFVPIDFLASQAPSFTLYGDGVIVFQPKVETFPSPTPPASSTASRGGPRSSTRARSRSSSSSPSARRPRHRPGCRISSPGSPTPRTRSSRSMPAGSTSPSSSAPCPTRPRAQTRPARAGFWKLASRLRDFDSGGTIPTDAYQADRYRGVLFDREPQAGLRPCRGPGPTSRAIGIQGGAAAGRWDEPAAPHAHAGAGRGARDQGRHRRAPGRRSRRAERQVVDAHGAAAARGRAGLGISAAGRARRRRATLRPCAEASRSFAVRTSRRRPVRSRRPPASSSARSAATGHRPPATAPRSIPRSPRSP